MSEPLPAAAVPLGAEPAVAALSPRSRFAALSGMRTAAQCLGRPLEDLRLEVLSSGPRGVVWRCRAAAEGSETRVRPAGRRAFPASVVLRHFLRRDGARNSGGFGYLRALHGHRCLPHAPRLLAADDDARVLVSEDLAVATTAGDSSESVDRWLRSLPSLCVPAESAAGREFRAGIDRADPEADAHGGAGALASCRLLCADGALEPARARALLDPRSSVLWSGDLNPQNFLEVAGREWIQVDLEGAGWCHPALLVAEVEAGLPLSGPAGPLPVPTGGWADAAERLTRQWSVDDAALGLARTGLASLTKELGLA